MKIRKFKKTDLSQLKKLVTEKYYWEFFKDDHFTKFVATNEKDIIGVAVTSITLDTANLDFIFVSEEHRSKKIGHSLLQKVEYYITKKKVDGFGVNCGIENKKAQKFYKDNGFKRVGKVYNYFSNNNWQIFFWKKV